MIIKLKPIPQAKIWGGDKLSIVYGINLNNIGEIWGISAHKTYSNIIINEPFNGMSFRELYYNKRELFGNYFKDEFPLLLKIIDAKTDLSVQVHPNDEYAFENENSYGKDECWYILEAKNDSIIQIGHNAKSKEDFLRAFNQNNINKLLNYISIKSNDFFYIPSGKVHAICKDTTLLEISQSSDITYRLYDYNRLDSNNNLRELHIKKSLDVITVPDDGIFSSHIDKYFTFKVITIDGGRRISHKFGDYIYIIEGSGYINEEKVNKGDFLFITSNSEYSLICAIKFALINIS